MQLLILALRAGRTKDRNSVLPLINDKHVEEEAAFGKWRNDENRR